MIYKLPNTLNDLQGYSRSLVITLFDRSHTTSYIVTIKYIPTFTLFEILPFHEFGAYATVNDLEQSFCLNACMRSHHTVNAWLPIMWLVLPLMCCTLQDTAVAELTFRGNSRLPALSLFNK